MKVASEYESQRNSKTNEITIAIIGVVGMIATGVISNWDKIFSKQPIVQATYSGYRPTGNFESELRYYLDISGSRQGYYDSIKEQSERLKEAMIAKDPHSSKRITRYTNVIAEEAEKYEEVVRDMLPVYQKYFTLQELQELNKFYSTEIMQDMRKKRPAVSKELAALSAKRVMTMMERMANGQE